MSEEYLPAVVDTYLPAVTVEKAMERRAIIANFVAQAMKKDHDYGVIPGTPKPSLLKPGAEKLCNLFGLSPSFTCVQSDEDWTGAQHGGEPFFRYKYKCILVRNGVVVGEGEGSCNSWEKKYRYRDASPKCPQCGAEAICRGKEEYGGGWYCNKRKGGCGTKFEKGDTAIEGQEAGRIPNPDIADQVNTIEKMAQKRALIAATLIACSASEFFTQDVDDGPQPKQERPMPQRKGPASITEDQFAALYTLGSEAGMNETAVNEWLTANKVDPAKRGAGITPQLYEALVGALKQTKEKNA